MTFNTFSNKVSKMVAPWPGFEPGSRYMILGNVGRATAAYTRPDYTTRASSFIKKRGFYLNFSLLTDNETVDAEVSILREPFRYTLARFAVRSHRAP